jgi:hypothetical protein
MKDATRADVVRAITERTIVRTWPMRGTLHFVPAVDAGWMLELLASRVIRGAIGRNRQLELDDATFRRARTVVNRALACTPVMTRSAMFGAMNSAGISTAGQRGIHLIRHLCMDRMLCQGPHAEKEPTFVLMDEWVRESRAPSRDEALLLLAERYFTSHGPASVRDFANWTGLSLTDSRTALHLAKPSLATFWRDDDELWMSNSLEETQERPETHLLPGFDEYLLGYRDRSDVLRAEYVERIVPGGNGVFQATLVLDGLVKGTWRRAQKSGAMKLTVQPFVRLSAATKKAVAAAGDRYAAFLGIPVALEWTG